MGRAEFSPAGFGVDPFNPVTPAAVERLAAYNHEVEAERESRLVIGVLVSGSGSNLQAILDACADGRLHARVAVVISDKVDAYGLERARLASIPAVHVDRKAFETAAAYNEAIRDALLSNGVTPQSGLVVMAGYMRLLGTQVLDAFPMRVVNLHPALLPSFPGAHAIEDALAYGVKVTGVTVHFADAEFDRGPIIAQVPVKVFEDDTAETLAERIHEVEHIALPAAIELVARGRVEVQDRRVIIR